MRQESAMSAQGGERQTKHDKQQTRNKQQKTHTMQQHQKSTFVVCFFLFVFGFGFGLVGFVFSNGWLLLGHLDCTGGSRRPRSAPTQTTRVRRGGKRPCTWTSWEGALRAAGHNRQVGGPGKTCGRSQGHQLRPPLCLDRKQSKTRCIRLSGGPTAHGTLLQVAQLVEARPRHTPRARELCSARLARAGSRY